MGDTFVQLLTTTLFLYSNSFLVLKKGNAFFKCKNEEVCDEIPASGAVNPILGVAVSKGF
jgi:hypothetical protein